MKLAIALICIYIVFPALLCLFDHLRNQRKKKQEEEMMSQEDTRNSCNMDHGQLLASLILRDHARKRAIANGWPSDIVKAVSQSFFELRHKEWTNGEALRKIDMISDLIKYHNLQDEEFDYILDSCRKAIQGEPLD